MHFGIEYRLESGRWGLHLFTAEDLREANHYVDMLCTQYGYNHIANLKPIPDNATGVDLLRLYPGTSEQTLLEATLPCPEYYSENFSQISEIL